jgi:transposase-like protein
MARRKYSAEEIIANLREIEVRLSQGESAAHAARAVGVTEQTYYRWRREYGGLKTSQAKKMKELEKENQRLRKAVSDLTLDKMILAEAAKGNF